MKKNIVEDIKMPQTEKNIIWMAPKLFGYKRGASWYVALILIALILSAVFIWQKQYLAVAVIVLFTLVTLLNTREKSEASKYTINKQGLTVDNKSYPFEVFKGFWIAEGYPYDTLYFESIKKFNLPITVYLTEENTEEIKEFLKQFLPEHEGKKEIIIDKFSKIMKM